MKNKTKTIIQSYASIPVYAFSVVFMIGGIIFLIGGSYLSIMAIFVSLLGFSYHDGTEIDYQKKRVREFFSVGFIRFGDWQNIHPDNEFQLRNVRMAYTRKSVSMQSHTYHNDEFKLMLKAASGKFVMIKLSNNRDKLQFLQDEIAAQI